jgi:hypothetical protein
MGFQKKKIFYADHLMFGRIKFSGKNRRKQKSAK